MTLFQTYPRRQLGHVMGHGRPPLCLLRNGISRRLAAFVINHATYEYISSQVRAAWPNHNGYGVTPTIS